MQPDLKARRATLALRVRQDPRAQMVQQELKALKDQKALKDLEGNEDHRAM